MQRNLKNGRGTHRIDELKKAIKIKRNKGKNNKQMRKNKYNKIKMSHDKSWSSKKKKNKKFNYKMTYLKSTRKQGKDDHRKGDNMKR